MHFLFLFMADLILHTWLLCSLSVAPKRVFFLSLAIGRFLRGKEAFSPRFMKCYQTSHGLTLGNSGGRFWRGPGEGLFSRELWCYLV
jgi:hypothetical protein